MGVDLLWDYQGVIWELYRGWEGIIESLGILPR